MDERPDNSQQLMDILLVMDKEEKDHPSRQRSAGRQVTNQEPVRGQQRPSPGGSPRRYVLQFLFQPLESD